MNLTFFINNILKLAIALLIVDFVLLILNFIFNDQALFNLDNEGNIPTYYQSLQLLIISVLSIGYILITRRRQIKLNLQLRLFWLGLIIFGIYLSLDEALQIHEDISLILKSINNTLPVEYENLFILNGFNSATWLIFYVPLLIIGLLVFITILRSLFNRYGKNTYLLILAAAFYISVFVVEYMGMNPDILTDYFSILVAIEELAEMIGTSLIIIFIVKSTKDVITIN